MIFYLYRDEKTKRVILDGKLPLPPKSELLQTIEADNWLRARMNIPESAYFHVEGHGYF